MIEIAINGVTKNFGFKNVLNGVSLEVIKGDKAAIVGRNGTGKTTIFNIISQKEQADKGQVSIRKGAAIGFLEQISGLRDEYVTVGEVLYESFEHIVKLEGILSELENKMSEEADADKLDRYMKEYTRVQNEFIALDGYSMNENFNRIVGGFRLLELLNRRYNVLSGGQKTIVRLAATVLKHPDILLLDEPTNHLDVGTLEWFEDFIKAYNGTVVIISHDRYFLDKVVKKTFILEDGICSTFNGNYSYAIREQEKLLLQEFEDYKTQQKKISAMKAAIKRYRDWGTQADNAKFFKKAKELEKRLEKLELLDKPQIEKRKIPLQFSGERSGEDVLRIEDFTLSMGSSLLIDSSSMAVYFKEKVCIMGENGTGKTSLAAAILNKITGYGGTLKLSSSAKVGYIPQEIRFEDERASVLEAFRQEYPCTQGDARNILSKYYFFGDSVFKQVSVLSGGEKVLLKLAALVQNEVNFLILDEPTNHIDIETREVLEEALLGFKGTLLFISHDRYFINTIANKIVVIKDKKLISYAGPYEEYRKYIVDNIR